jgi:tRNA (mo5U34)-methyltransferase
LERDYPFSERAIFEAAGYPRMCFIEHSYCKDPTNWWVPNRAGVEAMLRSAGFEIEEHPEEEVFVCKPVDAPRDWPEHSLIVRSAP